MQRRKTLTEAFSGLSIEPGNSPSDSARVSLVSNLRRTLGKSFPHWGSIRGRAMRATFTIKMDRNYDYFLTDDDPDELFAQTEGLAEEVQGMVSILNERQEKAYENFMIESLSELIFGSNNIEGAGLGHDTTVRICREIFSGTTDARHIRLRTTEEENALKYVKAKNGESKSEAVIRSRKEIVQHALALKHMMVQMVSQNQSLSEKLICDTHRVLTQGIKSEDGSSSDTYGGIYRTTEVVAGLNTFTPFSLIPSAMKSLVDDFNWDITKAEEDGALDAYALGAKYCHQFVNVHPFLDGNGRICRLILNCILLKYAGIVIVLGEKEDSREDYNVIAANATIAEQQEEES